MGIETVNTALNVSNFLEAVSFYENIIGLRKKTQRPTYAVFDLRGIMPGLARAENVCEECWA